MQNYFMNDCGYVSKECLINLAKKDRATTKRLYYSLTGKLNSLGYRFKDQVDTEPDEVFSIVYLKIYMAYQKRNNFFNNTRGCCLGYLYRMAKNWFIDQTKKPGAYKEEIDNLEYQEEAQDDIEERYEILKSCEEEMSPEQLIKWRLYKKLKYFDGQSAKEIYPTLEHTNENSLFAWVHSRMSVLKSCVKAKNIP